jgi:mono/diheme cytochrome c family protein
MRSLLLFPALLLAPVAVAEGDPVAGEALFKQRCTLCHMDVEEAAPSVEQLKALEPAAVVEKMTTGSMAPMSAGLSDADKASIAAWLKAPPK